MSEFVGSNLDRMTELETMLVQQADLIAQINTSSWQQVQQLTLLWRGPDSQGFASEWAGAHRVRVAAAEAALRTAAETVSRNRQQQQATSDSLEGSGWIGLIDPRLPVLPFPGIPGFPRLPPWLDWRRPGIPLPFWRGPFPPFGLPDLFGKDGFSWGDLSPDRLREAFTREWTAGGEAEYNLWDWQGERSGEYGPLDWQGEASAEFGVGAEGSASASIGPTGAQVSAEGSVRAGLSAEAKGALAIGAVTATGGVVGFAGVQAQGRAQASIGRDGVRVNVGGEAFAGATIEAEGQVGLGESATVGGSAEGWAGVGIKGEADASIGLDEISLDLEFGAALGLGGSLGFDVSISPSGIASDVGDLASGFADTVKFW